MPSSTWYIRKDQINTNTTSTSIDRKHLLTLPKELKIAIVDHIWFPRDLENLRLTCKDIEPLASARLFRHIGLDLSKWSCNDSFFRSGHRAHRCIRYIVFEAGVLYDKDFRDIARMNNLREGIKQLLRLLPRHFLKGIETPTLLPLDDEIIAILATTQENLVRLSLGPIHGSYLALQPPLSYWPRKLQFLEAQGWFGDERDITSYRKIMKNSHNLKELVLGKMIGSLLVNLCSRIHLYKALGLLA